MKPHLKNVVMTKWIKQYLAKGLSLDDAQSAARWRSGTWSLSKRLKKIMEDLGEV
tara:strand:+ start:189 stop:353 length:165 start_codon:yes stop_codon:yes gene_type:complete